MIEIRIHGRGGQGAVVASQVLAAALFQEGKCVQSFPTFGVERRGAPVAAFTRMDDREIRLRCEIYEPDHLMVLDPTLIEAIDVTTGLKENGWIVINSDKHFGEFHLPSKFRIATVDANAIAVKHNLGTRTAPIVNTAILGAFSRITELVSIEAIVAAVKEEVPLNPEENAAACREAYEKVRGQNITP
ncbi:MAG: 2-oxoacid:acceptor oxidoreductase family protein [Gemmatimonadota bacterium]|nr:MAG: 2-oxoacid:acceptor oxidoreductase family protein [Gemmatimonadota bacterium]